MKPVTPEEVAATPEESFPDEVFEAFNALIREKYRRGCAKFTFKEAAARVSSALGISTGEVYDRNLLDVEDVYRKAGWLVVMDKPGYNESYDGYWTFSKRRGGS